MALARSLIKRPKLLLLDEPLGALDKKLREHTQFELVNIQEQLGVTFVVVTHDQEEAMTLASRIGVMNQGRIVQVGTPHEIYEFPGTRFVAEFIGNVNMFEGRIVEDEPDHVRHRVRRARRAASTSVMASAPRRMPSCGRPCARRRCMLTRERAGGRSTTPRRASIKEIAYMGDMSIYLVQLDTRQDGARHAAEHASPGRDRRSPGKTACG